MSKYFNVKFRPDIVDGDISLVIDDDKTDAAFGVNDVLFDWQTVNMPKGGARLLGATIVVGGLHGAAQGAKDMELIFARSIDGVLPLSIGTVNSAASELSMHSHVIGALTMDKDNGVAATTTCNILSTISGGADQSGQPAIVLEGEPSTIMGYDTIYVAGITSGALNFSTNVLSNAVVGDATAATATTGIATKTTDPRKVFSPGDILYIHDVDVAIGTVKSVTDNDIILESPNVGAIAESDELINATPIKITLHCES
tara:strand:+ start:42 stop:812 length:771 start_codon:yes stop_codon:yes gene_type:complete